MNTEIIHEAPARTHPGATVYQIKCTWGEGRKQAYRIVHAQYERSNASPSKSITRAFAGPIGGGMLDDAGPEVVVYGAGPQLTEAVALACDKWPAKEATK